MMKYQQNEKVILDNGAVCCEAKIVGIATLAQPLIGVMYIIEVTDGQFPNKAYPYTHLTAAEVHLRNNR